MSLRLGALAALALVALLILACSIDGEERSLTEEFASPTPTGTAPIFQRSPLPTPSPIATPTPLPTAVTRTPVVSVTPAATATPTTGVEVTVLEKPFNVTTQTAVNVRSKPSATEQTPIVGTIFPGEKAKVIGEAKGQEVERGKGDLWYQVELKNGVRGFVYAPLVKKV